MVSPQTVLVTGGAGFIGSHLASRLLDLGHRVVVVDDLSTGRLQNCDKRANFYHASVDSQAIDEIIERERPDVVSHHAGQVSFSGSVRDPVRDAEINIHGSVRIIEACRSLGVRKLIYASDASVYGEPQQLPCDEEQPIQPISPLGLSKYVAEQYLQLYRQLYRLDYIVLRYGNVYGHHYDPHEEGGLVHNFITSMLEGRQPRIFGTGEHERDFVYIDDAVEANILAMGSEEVGAYNVGSGTATSVNAIFELLKGILKYRWSPIYAPARPGEVIHISLDSSKAGRELGWYPRMTLEEGLRHTVEQYQQFGTAHGAASPPRAIPSH